MGTGPGVVTISASFGAGGSEIGPAVARGLGLPFVDRAIPAAVARKLDLPASAVERSDEALDSRLERVVSSMALIPDLASTDPLGYGTLPDRGSFRVATEEVLREIAVGPGGVILGRAAALVLRTAEPALHVRLDGPEAARAEQVARRSGRDPAVALREVRTNDSARVGYVRHFYRSHPAEARHYHLVIDTTALSWEAATSLIVAAARARGVG